MSEITTLDDSSLESFLTEHPTALLLFTTGEDLRGEFSTALKNAIPQYPQVAFGRVNPQENPQAVERFGIGRKSVLVGVHNKQEIVRRNRPWGTDIPLAIEMLEAAQRADQPPQIQHEEVQTHKEKTIVDTKPVNVTDATFEEEVLQHDLPVVVDFWADWCGPCKMVAPILEKLAGEYAGKVRIAKVDVDANPGLAQAFQIMSIPTIMMIKERTIVFSQPGALPENALRDLFNQLVELEIPEQDEQEETENS